jgi:hypothetical protein
MRSFVALVILNVRPLFCLQEVTRRKKMKNLRQFCAAVILTLALALSAFAGDMDFPGDVPPPPPPPSMMADTSTPSATIVTGTATQDVVAVDPVTEAALSLLQSVLSIF